MVIVMEEKNNNVVKSILLVTFITFRYVYTVKVISTLH